MKKMIQPSTLNSKVGRTYTLDSIYAQEAKPLSSLILDMINQETIPISMEQPIKLW